MHHGLILLLVVLKTAVIGGAYFRAAGRWDLPLGWAWVLVLTAISAVGTWKADPDLIRERARPGEGGCDYFTPYAGSALYMGGVVLAGLDVGHGHWTDTVPRWLASAALLAT